MAAIAATTTLDFSKISNPADKDLALLNAKREFEVQVCSKDESMNWQFAKWHAKEVSSLRNTYSPIWEKVTSSGQRKKFADLLETTCIEAMEKAIQIANQSFATHFSKCQAEYEGMQKEAGLDGCLNPFWVVESVAAEMFYDLRDDARENYYYDIQNFRDNLEKLRLGGTYAESRQWDSVAWHIEQVQTYRASRLFPTLHTLIVRSKLEESAAKKELNLPSLSTPTLNCTLTTYDKTVIAYLHNAMPRFAAQFSSILSAAPQPSKAASTAPTTDQKKNG